MQYVAITGRSRPIDFLYIPTAAVYSAYGVSAILAVWQ